MRRRSGFTIVELLIVITIISILMALTIGVVGAFVGQARESSTQALVKKVSELLHARAAAADRLIKRPGMLTTSPESRAAGLVSGGNLNVQKIVAEKLWQRRWFPQRYQEVVDAQRIARLPVLMQEITNAGGATNPELLHYLATSPSLGQDTIGTDAFSTAETADIDGNGLREFVDAWGNPLRFYRWPTRLFRPGGEGTPIDLTNAKLLLRTLPTFSGDPQKDFGRDPSDPLRRCSQFTAPPFEQMGIPEDHDPALSPSYWCDEILPPVFHTPATYHVLLVVSAGPDGQLGMFEPDDVANNGHLGAVRDPEALMDDITHLNTRAGGK